MALDYTTTGLISNTKRRMLAPSAQSMFPDQAVVDFLNDELQVTLVPAIKAAAEEFFVVVADTTVVAGQTQYDVPARAFTGSLRDVSLVDGSGNETYLAQFTPETLKDANSFSAARQPYGFYMQGNKLVLTPSPVGGATTIRLRYERRPNNLIQATQAMTITNVNTGLNQVTVSSVPTGVYSIGSVIDFIKHTPYFDSVGDDYAITNIAGNVFTFASLPTGLAAGNYMAISGYAPVPQIPYEGMLVLCQLAASAMLLSQGAPDREAAKAKADEMMARFIASIAPRVKGTPKKIVNRGGIFANGGYSRGW